MKTTIQPWLQCVELHPDVLSDDFSEDIFALDLGTLADYLICTGIGRPNSELPRVPPVYRDSESFFQSSYLTSGLRSLLGDVLGRLTGLHGNRVVKLSTPFGGGKSHTLAALLHAAHTPESLDLVPEAADLPRPDSVRVAVVDGQFFDAAEGKEIPNGQRRVRTIWGWIAWMLGRQEGYELVREQDRLRVAPGADQLVKLLRRSPSLILLDELLEYLISAGGIRVEQTTLRDETVTFLKRLTVAVGSVENAMMVYSLQSSKRESLEYDNLLRTIEHLAARKDQRREPVEGNEILHVVQRRLLARLPSESTALGAAEAYRQEFSQMRRAYYQEGSDRRQADEDGLVLRDRIRAAYPFHPALIDLMRERWAAIPDFQRTRGALRFLATCLRAAHRSGYSRLLLGPGDVPIHDQDVRLAFFKEVGQREDFQACLEHDFVGANARARRIDNRRAREITTEAGKNSAIRIATTMLLSSFGGLRRSTDNKSDSLPPGIGESDLMSILVGPDLDSTTIQACLKELKERCLYLHFDGVRYCYKKDPNVTLLIEQEAEAVSRDKSSVRDHIEKMMGERLADFNEAIIWPENSSAIPDRELRFLLAYMPLEFTNASAEDQRRKALEILEECGNRNREFRNGIGLAIPSSSQVDGLRQSVRYLIAIERIQNKWRQHNLTEVQKSQLKERRSTERTGAESALLKLYEEVWLLKSGQGRLTLDPIRMGGRPLKATLDSKKNARIHERLMEILIEVQHRVFTTLAPGKIPDLYNLGSMGSEEPGISTRGVAAGFFSFLGFPRLVGEDVVLSAVSRGVETGLFGYVTGQPTLGENGRYEMDRSRVAFQRPLSYDEIDIDSGFLMVPSALPEMSREQGVTVVDVGGPSESGISAPHAKMKIPDDSTAPQGGGDSGSEQVCLSFSANRTVLFDAWSALANLADIAGEVEISVTARVSTDDGRKKLENGVIEPLRELDLIDD